ncbi:MAG: polymer-forming cytoskeletal protein [Anaerolineae bacterium]|nr:polymer-forming cytoskeletal protein [Anaerolineae bacterium]
MRRTRIFVIVALALLALLALAPAASAQGPGGVVVGGERIIESGQTFSGDMAVFGGNLTVRQGGTINGNLTVFGGDADIAGTVRGNITSIGGSTRLRESAVVEGDISTIGGSVNRASGATVRGQQTTPGQVPPVPALPNRPAQAPPEPRNPVLAFLGWVFRTALVTLGLALLAVLAVALLPNQMRTVVDTMRRNPAASTGIGALTWVVWVAVMIVVALVSALLIFICIGLLGIPVLIVLGLVVPVAVLFGWLSTGLWVGEGLLRGLRVQSGAPLVAAGLGAIIITLIYQVVNTIPCLGWLLAWLMTLPGFGAVILTWFGTRGWRPGDPYLPSRGPRGPVSPATPPGWAPPLGAGSWTPAPTSAPTPPPASPTTAGDAMLAQGAAVAQAAREQAQAQPPSPWARPVTPPPAPSVQPPVTLPAPPPVSTGDLLTRLGEDIAPAPVPSAPPAETPFNVPPVEPPAPVVATPTRKRDNLQVLPLVGPKYEGLFNARDVYSYADLAGLTPAQVVTLLTDPNVFPVTEDQARAMIDEARRLAGE